MSGITIPEDIQNKLLSDPAVQQAIKQYSLATGKDAAWALKDAEVQRHILKTCKHKFPEYAAEATHRINEFVSDPDVKAKVKEYASIAAKYMGHAGVYFVAQIEHGPIIVRFLALVGGIASCLNAVRSIINPLGLLYGTVMYVLSVYQVLFSLTTMIFEAKPSWVQRIDRLDRYQDILIEKAKFLAETLGRGLSYIFQGTLWLCFASSTELFDLGCGMYMVFIGILSVLMHYGGYKTFAEKVSKGYRALAMHETA